MKQFKTVCKFEYLGYINNRMFRIITCVLFAICVIVSFIPQIFTFISSLGDEDKKDEAAFSTGGGYSNLLTEELLNAAVPSHNWTYLEMDETDFSKSVEDGEYKLILVYNGGAVYDVYTTGRSFTDFTIADSIAPVIRNIHTLELIEELGLSEDALIAAELIETMVITPNMKTVGEGDFFTNYFLAYVLVFVLYISIMMYMQFIMTSVVTEKSSKAMELLITSAKPNALIFGKVIGVGGAALTQMLCIVGTAIALLSANNGQWQAFSPLVTQILDGILDSPFLIVSFIVFFILGFFTYAFLSAALGSLCSRIEDVNSVGQLPIMLIAIQFITALIGGMNAVDSIGVKIMSYIPLFTPMVMFTRQCMNSAASQEVVLSMFITAAGVYLTGLFGAKIYRTGTMMYGKPPKPGEILKMLKQ